MECEGHSFRVDDKFPIPRFEACLKMRTSSETLDCLLTFEGPALGRGVKIMGGSSWFLLTRTFVKWIDGCLDVGFAKRKVAGECSTALMLLDYGQYKINFEEVFYQTVLLMNSGRANLGPACDLTRSHLRPSAFRSCSTTPGSARASRTRTCASSTGQRTGTTHTRDACTGRRSTGAVTALRYAFLSSTHSQTPRACGVPRPGASK